MIPKFKLIEKMNQREERFFKKYCRSSRIKEHIWDKEESGPL